MVMLEMFRLYFQLFKGKQKEVYHWDHYQWNAHILISYNRTLLAKSLIKYGVFFVVFYRMCTRACVRACAHACVCVCALFLGGINYAMMQKKEECDLLWMSILQIQILSQNHSIMIVIILNGKCHLWIYTEWIFQTRLDTFRLYLTISEHLLSNKIFSFFLLSWFKQKWCFTVLFQK